jgi:hypothetical protein
MISLAPAAAAPAGRRLRIASLCAGYGRFDPAVMAVPDAELAWGADNDPHVSAVLPGAPELPVRAAPAGQTRTGAGGLIRLPPSPGRGWIQGITDVAAPRWGR